MDNIQVRILLEQIVTNKPSMFTPENHNAIMKYLIKYKFFDTLIEMIVGKKM